MAEIMMTVLLAAAGICDLRERKIPNRLICVGWMVGLCAHLWRGGIFGAARFAAAVLAAIALGFPVFWIRAVGAGDVKLLSVIGGLHGLRFLLDVSALWMILSGIVSAAILVRRRILLDRLRCAWRYLLAGRGSGVPYYSEERDGRECTVILAPFLAAAYVLVLVNRLAK